MGAREGEEPPAALGGVTRRFWSCHHHMADGNFHSVSSLVKWEGSPTLVFTSPPPPPLATAVRHTETLGKTPTFPRLFLTFIFRLPCMRFAG